MIERHSINPRDAVQIIKNDVRSIPGFGDSGEKQFVMEFRDTDLSEHGHQVAKCGLCGYDRVLVTKLVRPESIEPFQYDCMNPNCGWNTREQIP